VVEWFKRRRPRPAAAALRSRDEIVVTKLDLHEFTPGPTVFLAKAAYVQLTLFENLSRVVSIAPTAEAKASIAIAAQASLAKHRSLYGELERLGVDAGAAMEEHRAAADRFQRLTLGADWTEAALTNYLAAGFLDETYAALSAGLLGDLKTRARAILLTDRRDDAMVALLAEAMESNPRLAPRLAMWGRRVLGDTMLLARDALEFGEDHRRSAAIIEPAFTELIAEHTRRMDRLGLAA
jgi:hypothetical protein